ncbi:hypothetical protein [Terrihabitans rhizophilus]|uniref:Uncharacterized protein n=1 Tax=Terrihabitans rhizophilus TaxID=3092662 RepID=A0ABU4RNJ7_9HYPH|nr:hypothetical protein [Terrihabitans sp. PJ23]MDX6806427.1 hypothetical protein [Terrihabitans sp. PJ23]
MPNLSEILQAVTDRESASYSGVQIQGLFAWRSFTPNTTASGFPTKPPIGVFVSESGSYELELATEGNGTSEIVTLPLMGGVPYEIANLLRVRSGAPSVMLLYPAE